MEIIVFLVGLSASVYLGLGVRYFLDKQIQDGIGHLYFGGALVLMALCLHFRVSLFLYAILTAFYIIVIGILVSKRQKKI